MCSNIDDFVITSQSILCCIQQFGLAYLLVLYLLLIYMQLMLVNSLLSSQLDTYLPNVVCHFMKITGRTHYLFLPRLKETEVQCKIYTYTLYYFCFLMTLTCTGASPLPLILPGVNNPETALSLPVGGMRGEIDNQPPGNSVLYR